MIDNSPRLIKEWKRTLLFGLVKINYHVEDRRPDLGEANCIGKYKHFLDVRVLWKVFRWCFRTQYPYDDLPFER